MKMNKLATLFLTTTLTLASGAALAADSSSQGGTGAANAAADAGQVAPDARENVMPNNADNSDINTGNTNTATGMSGSSNSGTMLHPNGTSGGANTSASGEHMSKDDIHKNSQCKDGKCPDINEKVQTGSDMGSDSGTKTDGTSQ